MSCIVGNFTQHLTLYMLFLPSKVHLANSDTKLIHTGFGWVWVASGLHTCVVSVHTCFTEISNLIHN